MLVIHANRLYSQGFALYNPPVTLCFSGDWLEIFSHGSCEPYLNNAQWWYLDLNGNWQYFNSGQKVFVNPDFIFNGDKSQRELNIKINLDCKFGMGVQSIDKTYNLVDNDFFNLKINNPIICNSNNISLSLLDLNGVLNSNSLTNIAKYMTKILSQ